MKTRPEMRAICLMGPTATGKTGLAVRLVEQLPLDIISVDSAMVYRGMDIGTAKPDRATRARAPHRLLDIRDPEDRYSAGDFLRDAQREMAAIRERGRVPLLVGGTMMYFRALTAGMAGLPPADDEVRAAIDTEAAAEGWPALHRRLVEADPEAAVRIAPNDAQRIQRALEVYRSSGKPLTVWHREQQPSGGAPGYLKIAVSASDRGALHERIGRRLEGMLAAGFIDELERLRKRPSLSPASPSMRAVGYRQFWSYLDGRLDYDEATAAAAAATRQLAKRQMTWLRKESAAVSVAALEVRTFTTIQSRIVEELHAMIGQ